METKRTFYQAKGETLMYKQIEFQKDNTVILKSGIRGGKQEIESKQFPDAEPAIDFYFERYRQYKAEDNIYPWAAEIKFTMDLTKQVKTLTQEKFNELLQSISCMVEDYLYETVNGVISKGIKKVKGTLYSISLHLIDKEPAIQELIGSLSNKVTEDFLRLEAFIKNN